MFRSHLVSQGIQKIRASMPGRRNSMVQATPEFDNPISIQTLPVLSGGCLAKPQVVEPVEEVEENLFCNWPPLTYPELVVCHTGQAQ